MSTFLFAKLVHPNPPLWTEPATRFFSPSLSLLLDILFKVTLTMKSKKDNFKVPTKVVAWPLLNTCFRWINALWGPMPRRTCVSHQPANQACQRSRRKNLNGKHLLYLDLVSIQLSKAMESIQWTIYNYLTDQSRLLTTLLSKKQCLTYDCLPQWIALLIVSGKGEHPIQHVLRKLFVTSPTSSGIHFFHDFWQIIYR